MPSRQQLKGLKLYSRRLRQHPVAFPCPHCGESFLPQQYEAHCTRRHELDSKRVCVWCSGGVSWPKGQKNQFAAHLVECWLQFKGSELPPRPPPLHAPSSAEWMCPPKHSFGRSTESLFLEDVFPMPADPCRRTFGEGYLDMALSYVERFLQKDMDWFHVMVSHVAFDSFRKALQEDEGRSRTLPFWCWCDGGTQKQALYRLHRHMVVVSPRDHFIEVWKKVSIPRGSGHPRYYHCKRRKDIDSTRHLINTLAYVSKRESRCNFSFKPKRGQLPRPHHFQIHTPLPALVQFASVLLWKAGAAHLFQEQFQHLELDRVAQAPGLRYEDFQWKIQVKDIPGLPQHITVPVTAHTPNQFLYLGHRKIPLEEGQTTLIHFYEDLGEETWVPNQQQQKCLNTCHVFLKQITELQRETEDLRQQLRLCQRDRRRKMKDPENQRLRKELSQHQKKNQTLQKELQKYEKKTQRLRKESQMYEKENQRLQKELQKYEKKNIKLHTEKGKLERKIFKLEHFNST